jgi:thioesterase domain-containing protein
MQTALLSIWQGLFPGRQIGLSDDFFDLGGHSLLAARMVEAVRTGTGFPIPITALYEGATIAQLEQYILEHADAKETPEIVELKPGDGGPSFFLLHGDMTGGGFYARGIARALPPEQGFYIIPPMSHERFVASPTIEDMAAHHVEAVRRVQPHGPYMIGGYCVGGLVALEIARRLRGEGESVDLVLEIDTSVYNTRFRPLWPLVSILAFLARPTPPARAVLRAYLMGRVRRVNRMPALEQLKYIAGFPFRYASRKLRKLARRTVPGGVVRGGAFDFPGMAPLHQILLHHQRAMIGYMPKHYEGRVELIRATRGASTGRNPARDWSRIAGNLVVIPSDQTHHSILFTELPELVRAAIARVRRPLEP